MKERRVCLLSVDVRSAHNIGALFRTCDGFGAELIIVGASPRPKMIGDTRLPHVINKAEALIHKTSLGAENFVKWQYAETLRDALVAVRSAGYRVFAIEQSHDSKPVTSMPAEGNIALLVGREVEGLSEEEISLCDGCLEIPMIGMKESFNVSVAAAIGLYEAMR